MVAAVVVVYFLWYAEESIAIVTLAAYLRHAISRCRKTGAEAPAYLRSVPTGRNPYRLGFGVFPVPTGTRQLNGNELPIQAGRAQLTWREKIF